MKSSLLAILVFALFALLAPSSVQGQDQPPRWQSGQIDTFEAVARFSTILERAERNDEIVDVQIGFVFTTFIKHVGKDELTFSARIEQASYRSIEDSGQNRYALSYHTDPERRDPDLNIPLPNIDDLVGKIIEFSLPTDGTDVELLKPFDQIVSYNFDIKFFRQLVNERLFSRLLRWYFMLDLNQQGGAHEWTETFGFISKPDGILHFEPHFTQLNPGQEHINITIDGFASYEDNRDIGEYIRGLKELAIQSQNVRGNAVWNAKNQRTESLSLIVEATLEPKDIDPLGMRITRKHLLQEYTLRRVTKEDS